MELLAVKKTAVLHLSVATGQNTPQPNTKKYFRWELSAGKLTVSDFCKRNSYHYYYKLSFAREATITFVTPAWKNDLQNMGKSNSYRLLCYTENV